MLVKLKRTHISVHELSPTTTMMMFRLCRSYNSVESRMNSTYLALAFDWNLEFVHSAFGRGWFGWPNFDTFSVTFVSFAIANFVSSRIEPRRLKIAWIKSSSARYFRQWIKKSDKCRKAYVLSVTETMNVNWPIISEINLKNKQNEYRERERKKGWSNVEHAWRTGGCQPIWNKNCASMMLIEVRCDKDDGEACAKYEHQRHSSTQFNVLPATIYLMSASDYSTIMSLSMKRFEIHRVTSTCEMSNTYWRLHFRCHAVSSGTIRTVTEVHDRFRRSSIYLLKYVAWGFAERHEKKKTLTD